MLSFDVEEYFQVEAAAGRIGRSSWGHLQRRLVGPIDAILQALEDNNQRATFFVLGWVAQHEPGIVRLLSACGHEIASHGMSHVMITRQGREEFRQDVRASKKLLEDLCGQEVLGYRAPTFSITHETAWALDVLAETGYRYDSSVFPVRHDRYGVPGAPSGPHWASGPASRQILELPPLTLRLGNMALPVGGGGYLRLLPSGVVGLALRAASRQGWPGMIYLHPWELDPGQPMLPLKLLALWRHRVNLQHTEEKLRRLMEHFAFAEIRSLLADLQARPLPQYRYGGTSLAA